MVKRIIVVFFAMSFLQLGVIQLYVYADETLSLSSLIEEALNNNPQIQAAAKRYEAALARTRLLRTMPEPRLEYEYNRIVAGANAIEMGEAMPMRMYSVSQEIPFPTKLFLRWQAADKEAKSLEQEYKEKENEIIQKVKESYFMLSLVNKEIQITNDTKILLDQLIKTLTNRYSVNKASQQEVLKAQTEYAKLDNEVVLLEQQKSITQARLKMLLNRSQDTELLEPPLQVATEDRGVEKEKLLRLMRENRPELKAFERMVEKSEFDYKLAKQEYLPDIMLRYTRENQDGSAGAWAGMVGVTFPFWFWDKQDSFVKEAKAQLEQMRAEYQNLENMISYEVEAALAKVEAQRRLTKIYETSFLPQAEAAFKTASVGFEAGRNDFLDFLDSERMFLEFKLDYARALVELEIALADLERAIGTPLKPEQNHDKK